MNKQQYVAVIGTLEKIDRTGVAPELSGAMGRFLRRYARTRLSAAKLAVQMGLTPGRDGALRGSASTVVTVRFFDKSVAQWDETTTNFGVLYHVPALCDEFLSPVTLRLWSTSGAGAAGMHSLKTLRLQSQGLELRGSFQWKPPNVLLPNTAKFELVEIDEDPQWRGADYLWYFGEDIGVDPDPLSYVPFLTRSGTRLIGALRVVDGLATERTILVPFATKGGCYPLDVSVGDAASPSARSLSQTAKPASWLVVREPHSNGWTLLDACKMEHEELVLHSANWRAYLQDLSPSASLPSEKEVLEQVNANLHEIGSNGRVPVCFDPVKRQSDPLAKRLAQQMRFPTPASEVSALRGQPDD